MRTRVLATLGVASVMCASFAGVTSVSQAAPAPSGDKVSICHRTGSATNPYVQITVSKTAAANHIKNHDGTLNWPAAPYKSGVLTVGQDFYADPVTGCKVPPVLPPSPFVPCVVSVGVTQTATTVTGTSADDTIDCTNASPGKTILGLDGNDTITGTAFGDVINGGNGNDTVTGGPGDDAIEGGNGNDTLTGSAGNDVVTDVGDGNDTITP
ncbi:Hemolysin-type calcium-binding repeat-containing protein [Geodermatophilus amargosae]|uniref:Hemolysin-type calcium-binding repeat-containing protein n=1 Tax=Geodermatophilus amargosae TaxID=1296565 RepID=A0A1I7D9I5_9ACTN|nr:Hemolysin-type calcium-binding repeat-containing protein [Geodermatophilus amargosae]